MLSKAANIFLAVSGLIDRIRNVLIVTLSVITLSMYLIIVLLRNFSTVQAGWLDELTLFLNVWMILLGAGAALRVGSHVSLDLLIKALPKRAAGIVVWLLELVQLAFLATVVAVSYPLVSMNWAQQSSMLTMIDVGWLQGWPLSMGWPYLAIPVGFALMFLDLITVRLSQILGTSLDGPKVEAGI